MDETDRRCRICWRERETIKHMLEGCEGLRQSEESREGGINEHGRSSAKNVNVPRKTRAIRAV